MEYVTVTWEVMESGHRHYREDTFLRSLLNIFLSNTKVMGYENIKLKA